MVGPANVVRISLHEPTEGSFPAQEIHRDVPSLRSLVCNTVYTAGGGGG